MFFIEVYNIESEVDFHDLIRDRTVHVILVSGSVFEKTFTKTTDKVHAYTSLHSHQAKCYNSNSFANKL